MSLTEGTRLGTYEITGQIGAGGMGEVYRARDSELERDVAIKVLPESFASDEGRVARFEQEAKTLAALNHSNIAQVYGLVRFDGQTAIVMELIEGPTLADRIHQGPLPADEALTIAMQIADALEAAQEQHIVHRDLKPANVKLRPDGTVKVLDFGIAKALSPELSTSAVSPIMTTPVTQVGVILGTAAYMSPEQARGKPVDKRTDIWAFGCVLYEMLTGQLAFGGEDASVILARIIANETDLDSLPGTISPAVQRTIELCLRKDPAKRIADIRDVKLALAGEFETIGKPVASSSGTEGATTHWQKILPAAAAALVVGAAIASVAVVSLQPEPAPRPLNRFAFQMPEDLRFQRQGENILAVSPTGRHFVINTSDGLYLRAMDTLEGRLIPGTAEDLATPFFSPDGQSVGYWAAPGQIKRIGISGGAPVVIAEAQQNAPHGAYWATDGTIFVTEDNGISRVSATGGTPELLFEPEPGEIFNGVQLLPDGDTVLYSVTETGDWDSARIVVQLISTGERTALIEGGSSARYVETGHIVYALGNGMFAVAFDAETLTVSGGVVPLVQGVSRALAGISGLANYGISTDGTLIYLAGNEQLPNTLGLEHIWVGSDGREEALGLEPCTCISQVLSPDRTRIAFEYFDLSFVDGDIWIWSIDQQTFTRLTFDPGFDEAPVWSPDSIMIAYGGERGIFVRRADGTGAVEQLLNIEARPFSWSSDNEILYTFRPEDSSDFNIGVLSVSGDSDPRQLLSTPFDEVRPALSFDGRWLAYQSNESGEYEIYVRPYPDVDSGRWQISTRGGRNPQWAADGNRLHFAGEAPMIVNVGASEDSFVFSTPQPFIEWGSFLQVPARARDYGVSLDGERLLMTRVSGAGGVFNPGNAQFILVENWTEELKQLVPSN